MAERSHLSVTQLRMYLRCPLQYKFRYVDGLKIPPTSALCLGRSVHGALEDNYTQKLVTRQDLSITHLTDIFSDNWEQQAQEILFEEDEKPGKIKDQGIGMLRVYHHEVAPKVYPVYVEHGFELPIPGTDRTLKGYIDLVDEDGVIVDHKTTKRAMQERTVATDLQLTAYAFAYRGLEGRDEAGLRFDVMVRTKNPKIQQLRATRTQQDIDRFLQLLRQVNRAIETGLFYPNENFMCPSCGYRDMCAKW